MSDELRQESGTCEGCGHISTHRGMDCIYSTPVGCLCPDCMYEALCREHGQTPIDADWLRSVGFRNKVVCGMQDDVFFIPLKCKPWRIDWGRNSKLLSISAITIGFTVRANPTRGDVIRLCAALGVPLEGQ